ncbi:squalene synthase HpnC [Massilia sp.]|uniref:squalene synthase HpnC n=1 Tax=Massilia sp. TaxID=1882437 RepID=UPI00289BD420|nr:squalene synthase HpnC [Massilia sp.]
MAVNHYENFPVASILLPRRLVPAVEAIYAFARSADDLADEGDATPEQRLAALQEYERQLDLIGAGAQPDGPMFARLAAVVAQYRLSLEPMRNLLSAFKQDVVTHRYLDYATLLDYCRRSADPVGRLMLALYQADDDHNLREADAICSALQLTNFWQDVAIDFTKGRIYIPQEDLARFNVSESALRAGTVDAQFQGLMRFEVERARALMLSGAPLVKRLPGRIGMELRMIVQGGLRILEKLDAVGYDVFRRRPVLAWHDWLVIGWRALRM